MTFLWPMVTIINIAEVIAAMSSAPAVDGVL